MGGLESGTDACRGTVVGLCGVLGPGGRFLEENRRCGSACATLESGWNAVVLATEERGGKGRARQAEALPVAGLAAAWNSRQVFLWCESIIMPLSVRRVRIKSPGCLLLMARAACVLLDVEESTLNAIRVRKPPKFSNPTTSRDNSFPDTMVLHSSLKPTMEKHIKRTCTIAAQSPKPKGLKPQGPVTLRRFIGVFATAAVSEKELF